MKTSVNYKKFFSILSIVSMTLLMLGSCKKYPEGPVFSLQTPGHRLVGKYSINRCFVGGVELTNELNGTVFTFKNLKGNNTFLINGTGLSISAAYSWPYSKDYLDLSTFYYMDNNRIIPALEPFTQDAEIRIIIMLLKQREFSFEIEFNDKIYRYELEKNE